MISNKVNKQPLLSICIPTYNRRDILDENISDILNHQSFDENVQLVIGDNASDDGTRELVENFIKIHKDKNIKYYKNDSNIKDKNFLKVLQAGDGIYCKLLNDYTKLSETDLSKIIETVRKYKDIDPSEVHLGFFFRIKSKKAQYGDLQMKNLDDYILHLNNKMTWTSNFGCFKEQLGELQQFNKFSDLLMLQLFWTLHLAKTRNHIIICNLKGSTNIPVPNSKRSNPYNFFTPHVVNYYKAINQFTTLSSKDLIFDKTRLLSDFVGSGIFEYLILRKPCAFDLKGGWQIVWKYFHNVPYFYVFIPIRILKAVRRMIKGIIRSIISNI